jgi:hypothetical protein
MAYAENISPEGRNVFDAGQTPGPRNRVHVVPPVVMGRSLIVPQDVGLLGCAEIRAAKPFV